MPNKQQLISEFETKKLIEQDAHDFYIKASQEPCHAGSE
jgi:hypothetical protein